MSMKKCIKFLILLAIMCMIFFFSAQPANDSTIQANFVVDIFYKLYLLFVSKPSVEYTKFAEVFFTPVRKLAHFSEFMLLGIFAYLNIVEYKRNNYIFISLCFSIIYAISDEIHQIFVPGRACALLDVIIDSCGALVGIMLIHLVFKRWKRKS